MLMLVIIAVALVAGLVRGGSLQGLAQIQLRWVPLVLLGLALQLLIFTPGREQGLITVFVPQIYVLSMAILTAWVLLHRDLPGVLIMSVGLLMNLAAIAANGGFMPVDPDIARIAGQLRDADAGGVANITNSRATDAPVNLWILTDILPVPAGIPFANVFSLGDVMLTIGASVLIYRSMRRKLPPPDIGGAAPASQ